MTDVGDGAAGAEGAAEAAEAAEAAAEEVSNQEQEAAIVTTTTKSPGKKKYKKRQARATKVHNVHPDDVEICEARDIGSKSMLRNLHIGDRKVCAFFNLLLSLFF